MRLGWNDKSVAKGPEYGLKYACPEGHVGPALELHNLPASRNEHGPAFCLSREAKYNKNAGPRETSNNRNRVYTKTESDYNPRAVSER